MTSSSARPAAYRQFSARPKTHAQLLESKPQEAKRALNSWTVVARIGSAPFMAIFQWASERFVRSLDLTRRMQSA
eukprot:scaffold36275_cov154-Isochrysis_galbana.AAC.3